MIKKIKKPVTTPTKKYNIIPPDVRAKIIKDCRILKIR